uniref:Uncharacterized protein n=1 Tax=Rhizophora mucronata TaxID=61149 RepID=A0A2P2J000_RHIMU
MMVPSSKWRTATGESPCNSCVSMETSLEENRIESIGNSCARASSNALR